MQTYPTKQDLLQSLNFSPQMKPLVGMSLTWSYIHKAWIFIFSKFLCNSAQGVFWECLSALTTVQKE